MSKLEELSQLYGSGHLTLDASLLMALVLGFLLLLVLAAVWGVSRRIAEDRIQRDRIPIGGKLEKLERSLNEFRTETLRTLTKHSQLLESLPKSFKTSATSTDMTAASASEEEPVLLDETLQSTEKKTLELDETEADAAETETQRLSRGLGKTRRSFFERLTGLFSTPKLAPSTLDEIEAQLVGADLGVNLAQKMMAEVKSQIARGEEVTQAKFVELLKERVREILEKDEFLVAGIQPRKRAGLPLVVVAVGVNGVGKTTTVAKLAYAWKKAGASVLMVAADTFRAAAVQQLEEWGKRHDIPVVSGEGQKPSSVVFDGMARAKAENFDVVIIDTAGRLHTKANLMQELEGIKNIVERHIPGAPHEVLLVVDGATGQNAITQARVFSESIKLTGLAVTKLDGTSRGGVVVAIKDELGIPVRYIGVGEGISDLRPFKAADFVDALL